MKTSLKLEDVSIRDLDRLYEIEVECFDHEAFTKQQLASLLRDYNSIGLAARSDLDIAGFILSTVSLERRELAGHIVTIDVALKYRRRKIGTCLLQETERLLKDANVKVSYLEVREDNVAALGLYGKLGYAEVGRLRNYYGTTNGIYLKKVLF